MNLRPFGKSGIRIPEMGFGAWAIGGQGYGPTDDGVSLQALEAAWEEGVRFFDTADTYGHGHSEELIARFIRGKKREDVFIASKAGWNFYEEPSRKVFGRDYLTKACDLSLERLKCGVIDLYQLHNPSLKQIQAGEAVETLDRLRAGGKIRLVGISVHREDEALAALEDSRVDSVQLILNMLDQRMARNVLAKAREKGVAVIAREPMACGLLTGKYDAAFEFDKGDHRRRWGSEKRVFDAQKIECLKTVFESKKLPLAQAALEFVLSFPEVSVVIPGAKTPEHVRANLKASAAPVLSDAEIKRIREIFDEEIFSKGLNPS